MMKALLAVRFQAMLAALLSRGRQKKKQSVGMIILFAFLYLYLAAVMCGVSALTFYSLAEPYHMLGLDWLYFSMAGLMALGMSVLGSVFSTQSQMYDAKDNHLLLSMPIPPRKILLSRMIPLLSLNLLFTAIVMVPAIVVYAVVVTFQPLQVAFQAVSIVGIAFLAQAIACLLGWLLHLLLSKLNKSFASMLYLVVFLGAYFGIYSQAGEILYSLVTNTQAIADALSSWVWPLYAMGQACSGDIWKFLAFIGICAAAFGIVYCILSATFLRTATMSASGRKRRKLQLQSVKTASASQAVVRKELHKFLGTPVYLTNMGVGILMVAAIAAAGVIFREDVMIFITLLQLPSDVIALVICGVVAYLIGTMCISTPSVSLEGKNIWILKSLPIASREILKAKLWLHCYFTIPVSALSGAVLAITYGCGIPEILLCALLPGLLALMNGLVGMIAGLKWARLDYISEAYPCKQSVSVLVAMFGTMGVPLALGLLYSFVLYDVLQPLLFMALAAVLLSAACLGLYRMMVSWGVKKWNLL